VYIDEAMPVAERISAQRILFPWIPSPQKDLFFYISSALAGWLYVAIIVFAIVTLENPLKVSSPNGEGVSLGAWIIQKLLGLCVGWIRLHLGSVSRVVDRFCKVPYRMAAGQEFTEFSRDDGRGCRPCASLAVEAFF